MADTTIEAIQAINVSVGLVAPSEYPSAIIPALFPCAVTFAGPMDFSKFGCTTYITLVLLAPSTAGINPNSIFQQGTELMKALRTAYRALGAVNGYAIEGGGRQPSTRGGFGSPFGMMREIGYGGASFYGFEANVTLMEPELA